MKTISRGSEKREAVVDDSDIEQDGILENMVIVAFPGETWEEVGRIADFLGVPNARVVSMAIKKMAEDNGL